MSLPWFRFYSEFAGDPTVQSLAFEDQRHYVVLLCLKCNGTLDRELAPQVRERIIARALGLDPVTLAEVNRRLSEVGLTTKKWEIPSWSRRQFKADVSTERVRKSRKNKETGNGFETFHRRFGNGPDTDTDTDTNTEKNLSQISTLHVERERLAPQKSAQTETPHPRACGARLTLSALPGDWDSFCRQERPDLDPGRVFDAFRDYWVSVPGAKGRKADWLATWRNWVRREGAAGGNNRGSRNESRTDRGVRIGAELDERLRQSLIDSGLMD